tara:strand:- start:721 stop:1113 length:393 start_codon:yes stop_codon:yes gene_type:complete
VSIWKQKSISNEKPWGHEIYFNSPFGMSGKLIVLEGDKRLSLKYYERRDQVLYCLQGKVCVYAPDEKEFGDIKTENGNYFELSEGETILIQHGNKYRIIGLEHSTLIEVLVGTADKDIPVRLEDDYGRVK